MKLSDRISQIGGQNSENTNKLWMRMTPELKDEDTCFQAIAGKLAKDETAIEKRLFAIKKNRYLCYKKVKRNSKYKGILDLQWASVQFVENHPDSLFVSEGFGRTVRIRKGSKFTDIYVKDLEELRVWRLVLGQSGAIFEDLHSEYELIKPISDGSYGKVKFFYLIFSRYFYSKVELQERN